MRREVRRSSALKGGADRQVFHAAAFFLVRCCFCFFSEFQSLFRVCKVYPTQTGASIARVHFPRFPFNHTVCKNEYSKKKKTARRKRFTKQKLESDTSGDAGRRTARMGEKRDAERGTIATSASGTQHRGRERKGTEKWEEEVVEF
jgi:hypothetical protein